MFVWLPVVIVVAVGSIVGAVIFMARGAEKRRVEELQSLAPMLGFSLESASRKLGDSELDAGLLSLPLFKHGGARRVRNLMQSKTGRGEEIVVEFRYTVSTGQSAHIVEQTVAAFHRPGARIPEFRLSPEGVFSRIGHMLGGQDIDFDSNAEFSSRYVLKGQDPDATRAFVERQAVTYLADRPGWSAQGAGEWLIVFRASKREKVENLREWLDEARRVAHVLDSR